MADTEITYRYREDDEQKMEFLRYLLDHYDHDWKYDITNVIKKSSEENLDDKDVIRNFVNKYLVKKNDDYVTLKQIKELIQTSEFKGIKISSLKTCLERTLGVRCVELKRIGKVVTRNVFEGYKVNNDFTSDLECYTEQPLQISNPL